MNERFTEFELEYDLSDITALGDSTPTTTTNMDFAVVSRLKEYTPIPRYMTFEHNFSVLDGSKEEFADAPQNVKFFSPTKSDENGAFSTNPSISINFTEHHSSFALTLYFADDRPREARVTWKEDNLIIYRDNFAVTDDVFIIRRPVQNYNHIDIEFVTAYPDRYVKLWYIRYGCVMIWDEEDVKTAKIVQENDPISDKLPINKLTFDVVDMDDDTDPGNPTGIHNYFQRTQVMHGYEWLDGQRLPMGRYFLDSFSYKSNLCKMSAMSCVGLMDTATFNDGGLYDGTLAGDLIAQVMAAAGIAEYEVDAETAATPLHGTLAPMSCRKAMREILFACQSCLDVTDEGAVRVYKLSEAVGDRIPREIKFSTEVTKNAYVSGVEVKYFTRELTTEEVDEERVVTDGNGDPVLDGDGNAVTETVRLRQYVRSEISKGEYDEGTHKVVFTEPHAELELSAGTITASAPYWVEFYLAEHSEVTITGYGYTQFAGSVTVSRDYLEAGEGENVKSYTSTLCDFTRAKEVAAKILDYHSMRLGIKIKYLTDNITMDRKHQVDNPKERLNNFIAYYTRRTFDLSSGFVDTAKMIGYFDYADYYYYGRNDGIQHELYNDGNEVI